MSEALTCRSCGAASVNIALDLGIQPLANNLLRAEDLGKPEPKFPLRLGVCESCWLMQILDTVPPVTLFSEYLYFSSFSDAMVSHARAASERHIHGFGLGRNSLVVEVASNDGYLLQNFVKAGIPALGFEPASNIAGVAREKGIRTLEQFFTAHSAESLATQEGKADLILGNNVFAHAPDTNDFVEGLSRLLKQNGRIVLEFPYGVDFVQKAEFDTIYHEHVFYFTLVPLIPLFERHGLEIYDAERLTIHGGSLRLFAGHRGVHTKSSGLENLVDGEHRAGFTNPDLYRTFATSVEQVRRDLRGTLERLTAEGKSIAAYGASAKGSTLLNFCGLGSESIQFVADRSSYKQGRFTPGTHLPIVAASELSARQPDYTLLLTWNFADEILEQQRMYRAEGGKFIIPIPKLEVV